MSSEHTLVASMGDIFRQLCRQGYSAFDPAARVTLRIVHQQYGTSAPIIYSSRGQPAAQSAI